jgi:hypothetical protein
MKVSPLGQTVWAEGLNETFTVVRIDESQCVANLELMTGTHFTHFIDKPTPFGAIHPIEDVNEVAARIVREATGRL